MTYLLPLNLSPPPAAVEVVLARKFTSSSTFFPSIGVPWLIEAATATETLFTVPGPNEVVHTVWRVAARTQI